MPESIDEFIDILEKITDGSISRTYIAFAGRKRGV